MLRHFRFGCIALVICLAGLTTSRDATARAKTPQEQEEDLIRRGIELRKAGDDQGAWPEFKKAYEVTHSPRAAAQLGLAEQALGRWEDADVHISEALRSPADPWVAKHREALEQALGIVKSHVARVEVIGEPKGAEVLINGAIVGTLPLAGPVRVSAGVVDVELRAPGHVRSTRSFTLTGGQYQRFAMRLEKEAPRPNPTTAQPGGDPAGPGTALPEATDPAPSTPTGPAIRSAVKWSAFGLALAGVATGITASVMFSMRVGEFNDANCKIDGGKGVNATTGMPTGDCESKLSDYRGMRPWQIAGFVAGGAFAVTWLVLTLTEPSETRDTQVAQRRWSCVPTIGDGAAATCAVHF